MPAESRAPEEPYTHHFMTTVEELDGDRVVLEETYFYPEGGGQPADRGAIEGVDVVDVQTEDGRVVHVLEAEPWFGDGDFVTGSIDGEFRRFCMRAHTASHALYGAGRQLFDELGYGGFDISPEKVRVDFDTPTDIGDAELVELERLVNRVVWEDRAVSWETVPREEALSRDDVAYNTKTEAGVTDSEEIRLVEIEDWDVAACGGTHVRSTSEIGTVTVLDRSNPGQGLTRVEFTVGPDAIERRAAERSAAMAAARALDTTVTDLAAGVEALHETLDAVSEEREQLRRELVETQLTALREDIVEQDGASWLVGALSGLDVNGLAEKCQSLAGAAADVVVLIAEDGSGLAVATDGDHDAEALVERATDAFGGGGGGSPTVAQAGGLDADAEQLVALYR